MQYDQSNSGNNGSGYAVDPGRRKKPIFRRWWFWCLIILILALIMGAVGGSGDTTETAQQDARPATTANSAATENNAPVSTTAAKAEKPQKAEGQIGDYIVTIKESTVTTDYEDSPILLVTYSFTNNNDKPASFMMAIEDKLFQNGVELGDVFSSYGIDGYDFDNQSKEIQQGVTLDVQVAYKLNDTTTDVEARLSEFISFSDEALIYKITLG